MIIKMVMVRWYQIDLSSMSILIFVNQTKTASLQPTVAQFLVVKILLFACKAASSTLMYAILVLSVCQDAA